MSVTQNEDSVCFSDKHNFDQFWPLSANTSTGITVILTCDIESKNGQTYSLPISTSTKQVTALSSLLRAGLTITWISNTIMTEFNHISDALFRHLQVILRLLPRVRQHCQVPWGWARPLPRAGYRGRPSLPAVLPAAHRAQLCVRPRPLSRHQGNRHAIYMYISK